MPRKMNGRKRLAYGAGKIGVLPAETSGQGEAEEKQSAVRRSPRIRKGCSIRGAPAFCGGYFRIAHYHTEEYSIEAVFIDADLPGFLLDQKTKDSQYAVHCSRITGLSRRA